jgi:hypothetical protein
MLAEVVIHFGSDWRDAAIFLFGISAGMLWGFIFGAAYESKKK